MIDIEPLLIIIGTFLFSSCLFFPLRLLASLMVGTRSDSLILLSRWATLRLLLVLRFGVILTRWLSTFRMVFSHCILI